MPDSQYQFLTKYLVQTNLGQGLVLLGKLPAFGTLVLEIDFW